MNDTSESAIDVQRRKHRHSSSERNEPIIRQPNRDGISRKNFALNDDTGKARSPGDGRGHAKRQRTAAAKGGVPSTHKDVNSSEDTNTTTDDEKQKKKKKKKEKRHKDKKHKRKKKGKHYRPSSPVQLSQFLNRERGAARSAISGKKIQMKVKKSKEDKQRDSRRANLLNFLNSAL